LGIVLVDLRDNKEDGREGEGDRKGHDERVGGQIEELQVVEAGGMLQKLAR